ncbi:helix-turn-helix domain-containing protein [Dubosiella newyorkensis]|uniref:helix-turn-helix domain-containing protein n=1 Tax=Dubosiella newyorkensis TaxID=1862672 RepID=UPI0034E37C7B
MNFQRFKGCTINTKSNLTQTEMADKLQVSYSYYSKVESGNKKPGFSFLEKLKSKFPEYDLNDFFE